MTSVKLKFDDWQAQLHSVNTASDTKFRLKHEGALQRGGQSAATVEAPAAHPPTPSPSLRQR